MSKQYILSVKLVPMSTIQLYVNNDEVVNVEKDITLDVVDTVSGSIVLSAVEDDFVTLSFSIPKEYPSTSELTPDLFNQIVLQHLFATAENYGDYAANVKPAVKRTFPVMLRDLHILSVTYDLKAV